VRRAGRRAERPPEPRGEPVGIRADGPRSHAGRQELTQAAARLVGGAAGLRRAGDHTRVVEAEVHARRPYATPAMQNMVEISRSAREQQQYAPSPAPPAKRMHL